MGVWVMYSGQLELWKGLFQLEVRGVEQDLVSNVGQLELAIVPVEGLIINPGVHGPLGGPSDVLWLCTHNGEVVFHGMMTCDIAMVIDWERRP